jgi:hypothetical protein
VLILPCILAVASGLRAWRLGQLSFWYDEVVTMRLAEAATPAALIERLLKTDATRALLHPLLLQVWIRLFGSSEVAARALSALCGVVTVGLVWWIGRLVFDRQTGLWAAWLAALSPPLVSYSRESRMYALLVMVTCVCWGLLLSLRQSNLSGSHEGEEAPGPATLRARQGLQTWQEAGARQQPHPPGSLIRMAVYTLSLIALLFSHPLGLLMLGTLALGSLRFVRQFFGNWRPWLVVHLAAVLAAVPWLVRYFDHPPEFLSGRLALKFLIGTPIGFIGGNSLVLLGLICLAGFGLARRRQVFSAVHEWAGPGCLLLWLILPPAALYGYSWIGSPVFGPSRYTLFVAPAFLILVAQGLASVRAPARLVLGLGLSVLALLSLVPQVYDSDLKADWRAFAAELASRGRFHRGAEILVLVKSSDSVRNVEVETARYYLPVFCTVIAWDESMKRGLGDDHQTYLTIGVKNRASAPLSEDPAWVLDAYYPGLVVYRAIKRDRGGRPVDRGPAASVRSGPG